MKNKIKVVITGGIGSGKSIVTNIIENMGFPVIKADDVAKNLMRTDVHLKNKIIKTFGRESYNESGLNRKFLSENVFKSKTKIDLINSIVHPPVKKRIKQLASELHEKYSIVFIESALVFEAKIQKEFDYIILVYSDEETRKKRLIQTGNMTLSQVNERMKFQIPDEKKTSKVDFVIENNSSLSDLETRTKFIVDILRTFIL